MDLVIISKHHDIQHYIIPGIADAVPKDFLIAVCSLMDFQYLAQAPQLSSQICMEIDDVLKEFHNHKSVILSSGMWSRKARNIINNW